MNSIEQDVQAAIGRLTASIADRLHAAIDATLRDMNGDTNGVAHRKVVHVARRSPVVVPHGRASRSARAVQRAEAMKVSDGKVLSIVASWKDGATAIEISRFAKMRPEALAYRLRKLRDEDKIHSTGATSKMRWYVVK